MTPESSANQRPSRVTFAYRLKTILIDVFWAIILLSVGLVIALPMVGAQGFGTLWAVGLLIGVLIKLPPKRWATFIAVGLPGNFAGLFSAGWPLEAALLRTVADIVLVVLFLLWASKNVKIPFASPVEVVSYVGISIAFGTARTIVTFLANLAAPSPLYDVWQISTGVLLTTAIGLLVLAPLTALIAGSEFRQQISARSGVAAFVGIFLIIALTPYLFIDVLTTQFLGWFFVFIPLLVLIAITSHQWALSVGLVITALAFAYSTAFGLGPFVAMTGNQGTRPAALALQMFLISVPAAAWILAAALEQNRITNDKLQHLVNFDVLTGSRSRNWLVNWSTRNENGDKQDHEFELGAVLIIDASDYRIVEESFGQKSADKLLVELAEDTRRTIPADFIIARPDGFRFVVMAPRDTEIFELDVVAQQLLDLLSSERNVESMKVARNIAIGAAKIYNAPLDLEGAMQMAEKALKVARKKTSQRYKLLVQDGSSDSSSLVLETELREALANREFTIFLQPQFDLASRRVVGYEVLVRWFRDGVIYRTPDEFIPVLESSGLISQLGQQVRDQTFDIILRYRPIPAPLSINVSATELDSDDWFAQFKRAMESHGVKPHEIGIEITETTALTMTTEIESRLLSLKNDGVAIHIDDFGTGFASIASISKIPATSLKLDKSFVDEVHISKGKFEVVAAISRLARGLGLDTIAEGVENEAQVSRLLQAGWHIGQGYFFAKPGPPEDFLRIQSQIS